MSVRSKSKKIAVYTVSLLAIVLWGMSYIWNDRLLRLGIPVEYFVYVRVLMAGMLLLLYNIVVGHNIHIHRKDSFKFLALAACEPFIYFVCETYGIQLTQSPTYSALIIASTPIFSMLAGILIFREDLSLLNILGVLVCLGGLGLVTFSSSEVGEYFFLGILLLLVAVLAEVGHASFTKSLSGNYRAEVIVMYQFLIGSAYLMPLFLTRGLKNFEYDVYLSWAVLEPILCLALLCSSLAFTLWVSSIKMLGVAKSSIFMSMIPVVTAVAGYLGGTEILSPVQWGGILIAVFGVVFSQWACKRAAGRKAKR